METCGLLQPAPQAKHSAAMNCSTLHCATTCRLLGAELSHSPSMQWPSQMLSQLVADGTASAATGRSMSHFHRTSSLAGGAAVFAACASASSARAGGCSLT